MRSSGVVDVYPVNPGHRVIEGLECSPRISDVPDEVDLAVVTIDATGVPDVVRECVDIGIPAVVVVSSGFSELGEAGTRLEEDLRSALEGGDTRLLGPNTIGFIIPSQDLDVVFLEETTFPRPGPGPIGVISQSGSLGVDILHELCTCGTGISAFYGLGNKLDINECDVIQHLTEDGGTRSIACYVENISQGRRFLEVCRATSRVKPLVVLKGGRSRHGSAATSLHTGRMGGDHSVLAGALSQAGVVEAKDEVELVDLARCLGMVAPPRGGRALVVTNGGGNGIVAVDLIEEDWAGVLDLQGLPWNLFFGLREVLPPFISPGNPVDLSSEAGNAEFIEALRLAAKSDAFDIFIVGITANERIDGGLARGLGELLGKTGIPIIAYHKGFDHREELVSALTAARIPAYPSVRRAVNAAGVSVGWYRSRGRSISEVEDGVAR
jgi:acyl-CoA synthetase (NDP forming)